jgi:hypothetical protein
MRQVVRRTLLLAILIALIGSVAGNELAAEVQRINPPGLYKHPAYTRVITARGGTSSLWQGKRRQTWTTNACTREITRPNTWQ